MFTIYNTTQHQTDNYKDNTQEQTSACENCFPNAGGGLSCAGLVAPLWRRVGSCEFGRVMRLEGDGGRSLYCFINSVGAFATGPTVRDIFPVGSRKKKETSPISMTSLLARGEDSRGAMNAPLT
eukprot:m.97840 g.97840  ORF g.97840 m.97840 type:complete len:124 (-) comp12505_c2_seq6:599-970(-)